MTADNSQPDWIRQELDAQRHWQHRYILSERFSAQLPVSQQALNALMAGPEDCIKHDRTTTVKRVRCGERELIFKRYNARSFWHRIKRALRRSRAQRCWQMSYHFAAAGLKVARPALMYEARFGPLCGDAWFVSEFLSGQELLRVLPDMSAAEQQQVADAVRHAFELKRKHRLSHGDMKASNLLWVDGQLVFVDLDAASLFSDSWLGRRLWQRACARDLLRWRKNWRDQPALAALFAEL